MGLRKQDRKQSKNPNLVTRLHMSLSSSHEDKSGIHLLLGEPGRRSHVPSNRDKQISYLILIRVKILVR